MLTSGVPGSITDFSQGRSRWSTIDFNNLGKREKVINQVSSWSPSGAVHPHYLVPTSWSLSLYHYPMQLLTTPSIRCLLEESDSGSTVKHSWQNGCTVHVHKWTLGWFTMRSWERSQTPLEEEVWRERRSRRTKVGERENKWEWTVLLIDLHY